MAGCIQVVDGNKLSPLHVKTGDIVFFGKYVGTDAGDDYVILKEDDILGIINK